MDHGAIQRTVDFLKKHILDILCLFHLTMRSNSMCVSFFFENCYKTSHLSFIFGLFSFRILQSRLNSFLRKVSERYIFCLNPAFDFNFHVLAKYPLQRCPAMKNQNLNGQQCIVKWNRSSPIDLSNKRNRGTTREELKSERDEKSLV